MSVASLNAPQGEKPLIRAAIAWGIVVGAIQAATPLAFWWLDPATVYALGLAMIAAICVGFAVADGRWRVIAVESGVGWPSATSRFGRSPTAIGEELRRESTDFSDRRPGALEP